MHHLSTKLCAAYCFQTKYSFLRHFEDHLRNIYSKSKIHSQQDFLLDKSKETFALAKKSSAECVFKN